MKSQEDQMIQLQNNIAYHSYLIEMTKRTIAGWKKELAELKQIHENCDDYALYQNGDPREIDEDFLAQEYMENNIAEGKSPYETA